MVSHKWDDEIAFDYGIYTDTIYDGGVKLDTATSGTYITDIRIGHTKFNHYDEFTFIADIPGDTTLTPYYRSGDYTDEMGDWIEAIPYQREEIGMSLFPDTILTDYDIAELDFGMSEREYRGLASLDGTSRVGYAVVGESLVGSIEEIDNFTYNATYTDNKITLNPGITLTSRNVVLTYTPLNFIPTINKQNIQFKFDYTSINTVLTPTLTEVNIDYKLSTAYNIDRAISAFYRRL